MNRYFAIFHGLTPAAPWGVAVERKSGFPKVEVLMLCRTAKEAATCANLSSLGQELKTLREEKLTERVVKTAGAN